MNKKITTQQEAIVKDLYFKMLSASNIAVRCGLSLSQVYDALERAKIKRRSPAEQNAIRFRNTPLSFQFKPELLQSERELLIAAVMLYLGEGAKTGVTVDFTNCDPKILKIFLLFLRKICRVDESKIRIYLYCFENQNAQLLIDFWSATLNVNRKSFIKPYIRKSSPHLTRIAKYGVVHIRYSDKRLLEKILSLCEELCTQINV